MAQKVDKLTTVAIKKPKMKVGKHADGLGLYLEITPRDGRYWRFKYRFGGKEKRLALGVFDDVSLAEARLARDDARKLLRNNVDPGEQRKAINEAKVQVKRGTFPAIAAEWIAHKKKSWAPETARKAVYVTDTYLIPALRKHMIATLATKDAASVIEDIDTRAPNLAAKARQYLGGIVTYAIQKGLREDGRLLSLRGTVTTGGKGHIPAATNPDEITALVRAIAVYESAVTRAALQIAMLTALRPGVVASAAWSEIDLDAAEWQIPASKMKTGHAHIVPLPKQAIAILRDMQSYTAGREFVFPPLARQKTPHLHRDALSNALRRMGFQGRHATHGFRAMLRTAGRERLGIAPDVLEAQLAHAKPGEVQKAYDRTKFDDPRREAMQKWADYLDILATPTTVTPIKRARGAQ